MFMPPTRASSSTVGVRPRSVEAVKRVLESKGDYEHISMAVTMLMSLGGPKGRDAVLMAKTDHFDAKSRDYYQRILTGLEDVHTTNQIINVIQYEPD